MRAHRGDIYNSVHWKVRKERENETGKRGCSERWGMRAITSTWGVNCRKLKQWILMVQHLFYSSEQWSSDTMKLSGIKEEELHRM